MPNAGRLSLPPRPASCGRCEWRWPWTRSLSAGDPDPVSEPGAVRQRRVRRAGRPRTYFGINAADLNWQQAALLVGMVQSTSALDPYTNPKGALARRNLVLDTMIQNVPGRAAELEAARPRCIGVLPPQPDGCTRPSPPGTAPSSATTPCSNLARRAVQGRRAAQRLPDPHDAGPQSPGQRQEGGRHRRLPTAEGRRQRDERDPARPGRAPRPGDGRQPHVWPESGGGQTVQPQPYLLAR